MKTYLVTEEDIQWLKDNLETTDEITNWEKTLSFKTDDPYEDLQREIDSLKKKVMFLMDIGMKS